MSLATAKPFATVAYPLDEASGNALDAVGSLNLTDNNTVGAAVGLVGGARDLERNNAEDFSHADNAAFSVGDVDWTLCGYFNAESFSDGMGLAAKFGSAGNREYLIRFVSGPRINFLASSDGTATTSLTAAAFGNLSTATWYAFAVVHDSVANELRIYVNGTKNSASFSGGIFDGTATFFLGQDGANDRFDGLVDECVIVKGYAFTDADATEHYNAGAGVAFADWDAGGDTFTATIAATIGAATASASATFSPGTKTASIAATVGAATAAVSAQHTPPTYTATVAASVGAATAAVTATFDAPVYTAEIAATVGGATAAVSALFASAIYQAAIAAQVGAATAEVSATFAPGTKTATIAATVGAATAAVFAAVDNSSVIYTAWVAAVQVWTPGAAAGQVWTPGAEAGHVVERT